MSSKLLLPFTYTAFVIEKKCAAKSHELSSFLPAIFPFKTFSLSLGSFCLVSLFFWAQIECPLQVFLIEILLKWTSFSVLENYRFFQPCIRATILRTRERPVRAEAPDVQLFGSLILSFLISSSHFSHSRKQENERNHTHFVVGPSSFFEGPYGKI